MKILAISLLVAGFSGSALAGSACSNLGDYDVQKTSFSQMAANDAVSRILTGTPFQSIFSGIPTKLISARDVSGPLDQVLDALSDQAGVTYSLNRCVLTFAPIPPKVDKSLVIRAGDVLSERLRLWALANSYTLVWEAQAYQAGGDLSLNDDVGKTLDAVVAMMKINGIKLDVTIYENYVIRVTQEIK